MTFPRLQSHSRPAARRFLAVLLLTLAVSLGHVSVPWILQSSGRQIAFGDRPVPPEIKLVATRPIIATTLPPPAAPAPEPPPSADETRRESGTGQTAKPKTPDASVSIPTVVATPETAPQHSPEGTAILYSISGRFSGQQVGGSARLQWKLDPTAYLALLEVTGSHQFSTLFIWNARTVGVIDPTGMHPATYDEEFRGAGGHQVHSLAFAPVEVLGAATEQVLPLDPLSALLKLSSDLYALRQAAASPAEGSQLPAVIVRLGMRTLQFTVERQGDETLSSPFGLLRTEKFVTKSMATANDEPEIRIWLAPEFRYAPVRVMLIHGATTALSFDLFSEPADFPVWR